MKYLSSQVFDSLKSRKWFVTGGAGFIGSHVVDLLVSLNCHVTVYDNLSLSSDQYIKRYVRDKKVQFIQKDMLDAQALTDAMKGHDIVWHLGSNTDIPAGYRSRHIDLNNDVVATHNVLEAMMANEIKQILFSSTGAVYGESIEGTFAENSGPLIPLSLYGAGKLAAEAFISSYCHLFGIQAWIFRFGNVIGERTTHGIIFDFVAKLRKDPNSLEVLGTGQGEKNYFMVEECIGGMLYIFSKFPNGPFPYVINLGTDSTSTVLGIAKIIMEELNATEAKLTFTGTPRGWPGDQPVVLLDTTKVRATGWKSKRTSDEAVREATRRIVGKTQYSLSAETI